MLDEQGVVILSRRVEATEEALEAFCKEIAELGLTDERVLGIDLVGGPAALLEAVLLGGEASSEGLWGGAQPTLLDHLAAF